MPAAELMTWVKARKGWMKKYKGRMYSVSCKQLGCPPSREHSREAANQWWLAKLATLETSPPPKPNGVHYKRVIEIRRRMAQWFRDHLGQDPLHQKGMDMAEAEADRLQTLFDASDNPPPLTRYDEPFYGMSQGGQSIWHDRFRHDRKDPAPKERTIGHWVARWIDNQKARANAKEISTDRYSSYRYAIEHFGQWAGGENDIDTIDHDKVEQYYNHLLDLIAKRDKDPKGKAGQSKSYSKARLNALRMFCGWLDEKDLITLPKNLRNSKTLRIKLDHGKREIYPVEDVKTILADDKTPERMKLWVLLMLNTGAYQVDIANLLQSQVKWKEGRIERKRSKTQDHANVPVVSYRLWERTLDLLRKYANTSRTKPLALLNEDGLPLQKKSIGDDGKAQKTCNITTAYARVKTRLKLTHPLGQLRKTSANLLYNNPKYRELHTLFLGHSTRTVAEKFYVDNEVITLDDAIAWLGKELGLE
jgi:hypothetical protein